MYCFAKFCRLCLEKSDRLLDYQTKDDDNISLIIKINTLMPSLIISNENYPTLICDKCQVQLNNSYKFFNNCFKTNKQLFKYNLQLNFNGDKVKRELKVILDKLEGIEYKISGIKKERDEEYDVNLNDNLNIEKNDLEIKKEEIEAEIINPEKVEVVEDLLLNKIDGEVLANKPDGEVLANKTDGEVLALNQINDDPINKADGEVLANKIDGEVLANKPDDEVLALNQINDVLIKQENINSDIIIEASSSSTSITDSRKNVCKTCGKSFSNNTNLERHIRSIHLKIRYDCPVCEKTFTQLDSLNYHKRVVHLNIRKHKCDYCESKFPEPGHLKQHLKRCQKRKEMLLNNDGGPQQVEDKITNNEGGNSQFKCDVCTKKFFSKKDLTFHYNYHLRGKHSCSICREHFNNVAELRVHKKVAHPRKVRKKHKKQTVDIVEFIKVETNHEIAINEAVNEAREEPDEMPKFEEILVDKIELKTEEIDLE